MAFGMHATQTSQYRIWRAEYAVDGNIDGNADNNHCAHPSTSGYAHWEVSFNRTIVLLGVTVFNRHDCCK